MIKHLPKCCLGLLLPFLSLTAPSAMAQENHPDAHYQLISGKNYVQSKNYYLLTLLQELPPVREILAADTALNGLAARKIDALGAALKDCGKDGSCYTGRLAFSDEEIRIAGERLKALYRPDNALGKLVKEHLIPSGAYVLYQQLPGADMLEKAWGQDARGVNFAIGVYAEGRKPHYPNIDSISLPMRDPKKNNDYTNDYLALVYSTSYLLIGEARQEKSFFGTPLRAALHFIEMNERNQVADFEPMTAGENKAAYDRIRTTKWAAYKYSLILVPGAGPEEAGVPLSAEGMLRCRLAALQYQQGLAPFIMPSGGKVHPYKTGYCEALEMKKYLVEQLHIPAGAILIEPHARHTTTNMRNAARIMYRYGIPFDKAAITCTTKWQSNMIEQTLIARCQRELNEVPYKNGQRLSETEIEFYPLIEALQINPEEPMDP